MVVGDGIEDFGLRCQIGSTFWLTHTHSVPRIYRYTGEAKIQIQIVRLNMHGWINCWLPRVVANVAFADWRQSSSSSPRAQLSWTLKKKK